MYQDSFADKYQKITGFEIKILQPTPSQIPNNAQVTDYYLTAYMSCEPSTRSTYDIAMRDSTINGLVTMDNISNLKPGQIFYKSTKPNELYIIQSVNKNEMQVNSRNINAIKQNSIITIKRLGYNAIDDKEEYIDIYEDLVAFVSIQNKDAKNFQAGVEDNTILNIQIPKRDIDENIYEIKNGDRITISNIEEDFSKNVKIESIDIFGVPGVIRIAGTFETRTGD